MSSTRKIIRAFLASPGDLEDERRAIRKVVTEFNDIWADELGYHVELVGWEETVAGYGRPQQLINQDLDRSDLFLGMMWKRWGTPPDKDGKYTSGFEEEFYRSIERREEHGTPEISLFFKEIPNEFLSDPGTDLKRVLEFRNTIIAEKKILYQNFLEIHELEALVRKRISTYVNKVRTQDQPSNSDENAKMPKETPVSDNPTNGDASISPLAKEGFEFLEELVSRLAQPESISKLDACDVARFRLLASSVSSTGNDDGSLGVHDINIIYLSKTEGIELSQREIRCLTNYGFRFLKQQNVPLWTWYSSLQDSPIDHAVIAAAFGGSDDVKTGAIAVLRALGRELPVDNRLIKREWIIEAWFSKEASAEIRTAALKYLGQHGIQDDLEVVRREYELNDHGTVRSALECMIRLSLKWGGRISAQEIVINNQFEAIDSDLLERVTSDFSKLDRQSLLLGVEHRNSLIRLQSARILAKRGEIDETILNKLLEDQEAVLRYEALIVLKNKGSQITCQEAKKILNPPDSARSLLTRGLANRRGKTGDQLYDEFEFRHLVSRNEKELVELVAEERPHNAKSYFALVKKNFLAHGADLRKNIDDKFQTFFEEGVQNLAIKLNLPPENKLLEQTRSLSDFLRKGFTRTGLDILCTQQDPQDHGRILDNLENGFAGRNANDAIYLSKLGSISDIQVIASATKHENRETSFLARRDGNYEEEAAKAICAITRRRTTSELFSFELPSEILCKVIELCSEARFVGISQQTLDKLLLHESDAVRKAASKKTVVSFTTKRIKETLQNYVRLNQFRYYNVIHWLDLGVSMTRAEARKVVMSADF